MQAKNSVELKEWYVMKGDERSSWYSWYSWSLCRLSALARVCGSDGDGHTQDVFHSGAFVNNQWTWYIIHAIVEDYVMMMSSTQLWRYQRRA